MVTESIGEQIGSRLRGGEIIELTSDLGGGKTTLTRGIVAGVGSSDHVSSPTFTISKEYAGGRVHVYHYDFYRLHEAGLVADALVEGLSDTNAVTIVEWADIVHDVLPETRCQIHIANQGDDARMFTITVPAELTYLVEDVA